MDKLIIMNTNIYLTYIRYREKAIVITLLCLFLFGCSFLLAGIETVIEMFPYSCLAVLVVALLSFAAINYFNTKLKC